MRHVAPERRDVLADAVAVEHAHRWRHQRSAAEHESMIADALADGADRVSIGAHPRGLALATPPRDRPGVQEVDLDVVVAPAAAQFTKQLTEPIARFRIR